MITNYAVIDLFSGPGGLSEGFASINAKRSFGPFVSVEMDPVACNTLRLRKLYHFLKGDKELEDRYYQLIKSGKRLNWSEMKEVFGKHVDTVDKSVWEHELGSRSPKSTCQEIEERLLNLGHKETDRLVLIGGPPCQAYSVVGRSRRKQMTEKGNYSPEEDERHFLYEWYLKILPRFKPDVFIMENVPGILSSKVNGEGIFDRILKDLKKPGYKLFPLTQPVEENMLKEHHDYKIKSNLYGVPQARERVIILGIRDDLLPNQIPPFIEEKQEIYSKHVLDDLPLLRSGLSKINEVKAQDDVKNWKKELNRGWSCLNGAPREIKEELRETRDQIQEFDYKYEKGSRFVPCKRYGKSNSLPSELQDWYIDKGLGGYLNHEARSHMDSDLRRYLFNSVFTKVKKRSALLDDYPKALLPDHQNKDSGNYKDRFRTIVPNLPSKTITSHISKDGHAYIHYDPLQCRSLTVREAARLQSFPDNYFFCGNRTQQYHQVGNAVPPYLAKQIAEVVAGILKRG